MGDRRLRPRGIWAVTILAVSLSLAAEPVQSYRVYFPEIRLEPDEQIEGFSLSVACGHIEAITGIPVDWNIQVIRAISAVEELHATAGHGVSYVRQLDKFNGMVRISVQSEECFDVTANVKAVFDNERTIKLPKNKLRLVP